MKNSGGILSILIVAFFLSALSTAAHAQPGDAGAGKKYNIKGGEVLKGGRWEQQIADRPAIEKLLDESEIAGEATVSQDGKTLTSLTGRFKIDSDKPVEEAVLDFIDRHRDSFALKDPKNELKFSHKDTNDWRLNLSYQQIYKGIPIYWYWLNAHLKDGKIISIGSNNIPTPDVDIDVTPVITKEEAWKIAHPEKNLGINYRDL